MLTVKMNFPLSKLASDASIVILKAHFNEGRLNTVKAVKDLVAEREAKTGLTNYSAHVLDAAIYYNNGLREFSQLEAKGALDRMGLPQKIYMEDVLNIAAMVSARSAFIVARQYNTSNILAFKWGKRIKAVKSILGL